MHNLDYLPEPHTDFALSVNGEEIFVIIAVLLIPVVLRWLWRRHGRNR